MSVYKKDSPEYLKLALESIYDRQTKKPDEIVVVFDGPLTPELNAVLKDFRAGKEAIVKYYPQEVNRGLGEALRIGTEKCEGDYILRMDSDDISAPKRFEKQADFVEAHPEIDIVGTDIAEFDLSPDENDKRIRACPADHEDIVRMMKTRNAMNHVTACIKKSALEKCGGYKTMLMVEDYYLWVRMIAVGCRLANINESLVNVRAGSEMISRRSTNSEITGWDAIQNYMLSQGMISRKKE